MNMIEINEKQLEYTKIVEKRDDLLKDIQVGLEEAISIREYYKDD